MTITVRRLKLAVFLVGATVAVLAVAGQSSALAAGFEDFGLEALEAQSSTTQAGMHPDFTTKFVLNHTIEGGLAFEDGNTENISVALPAGLVGDPSNYPTCTVGELTAGEFGGCPVASQVGVVEVLLSGRNPSFEVLTEPLYNIKPPRPSVVARLGFIAALETPVFVDVGVRSAGDYGVTASVRQGNAIEPIVSAVTRIWGDPADPVHDEQRLTGFEAVIGCTTACLTPENKRSSGVAPRPFMSNPAACGAQEVRAAVTSYQFQNPSEVFRQAFSLPSITGCEQVPFPATLQVEPTSRKAGAPTGLSAILKVAQTNDVMLPSSSPLRDTKVVLPEGMTINPGAAEGLEGCSAAQVGYEHGLSIEEEEAHPPSEAKCPDASKIGTATFVSPDLSQPLRGSVYLRAQGEDGHLFGVWLVTDELGLHSKIPGVIEADPDTGRLTAVFTGVPQVPLEEIDLEFKSGPRAPLKNPDVCGTYMTRYELTPWSGNAPVLGETPMTIDEGCSTGGFAPVFMGGATSNQAGGFSPFVVSFSRNDGEQYFSGLTATVPAGVAGLLKSVPLCSDAEAVAGSCPVSSRIGSVTVGAGAGSNPFFLKGSVFLTGPYKGGPFGVVVVVPVVAGPFDLGTEVVRGSIRVDPRTAQATVVSDPFPVFVKQTGVPADIRRLDVSLDRPGFMFNPTDCEPLRLTGSLSSDRGTNVSVSSPFRAANCATLAFKPSLKVTTPGRTSRQNGAGLDVKLSFPRDAFGKDANIRSVKVNLPRQLPSRLTTLQKACPDSVFDANPGSCPAASRVGSATATTPILADPLTGPAYFVSHGGARFPELIVVLQGDGVTVDLHGETFISKAGITSSTFRQVPDVPVSTFELKLPRAANSALAANGNLCNSKLAMPTMFTAQNGAVVKQSTPVTVTGCAKHKTKRNRKR